MAGREDREAEQRGARHDAHTPGRQPRERQQRRCDRPGHDPSASSQEPGVLRRDEGDREADQCLDGLTLGMYQAEHCEAESGAVGDGEGGDQ